MLVEDLNHIVKRIAYHDDEAAFQELFYYYFDSLLSFSKSFLYNHQLAEEAVEDVFIRLWENRQKLAAVQNIKYYLFRSVKNSTLNYLVKHERKLSLDAAEVNLEYISHDSPEQLMIASEALNLIRNAINSLPPACKLIFLLVKEERFKYKEVAALLNVSVKTVETQMSLALYRLRKACSGLGNVNMKKP